MKFLFLFAAMLALTLATPAAKPEDSPEDSRANSWLRTLVARYTAPSQPDCRRGIPTRPEPEISAGLFARFGDMIQKVMPQPAPVAPCN